MFSPTSHCILLLCCLLLFSKETQGYTSSPLFVHGGFLRSCIAEPNFSSPFICRSNPSLLRLRQTRDRHTPALSTIMSMGYNDLSPLSVGGSKKNIAVIGGGLAGLSVTFHLLNMTKGTNHHFSVTVIDENLVGEGGASGAMAGILHHLTPRAKKMWLGDEGMDASVRLITAASAHSAKALVTALSRERGVLRLITKEKQIKDYTKASKEIPEVELVNVGSLDYIKGIGENIEMGLRIKGGCAVRGSEYTQGLLEACKQLGDVKWQRMRVGSVASVVGMGFDVVVIAAGAACCKIEELKDTVPLKCVRGQNIEYVPREGCGEDAGMLGVPIISGKYLVPFEGPDGPILCGGSTQEEDGDLNRGPDLARAVAELHEPLSALFKPLQQGMWIPSKSVTGVRGLPPREAEGSIPLVGSLKLASIQNAWLFTGLGARGLIHHAVLGELLARAIILNDESILPPITRRIPILGAVNQ